MSFIICFRTSLIYWIGTFIFFANADNSTFADFFVTFGDSYTDNGLYPFLISGKTPVPGQYHPLYADANTPSGGKNWGDLVAAQVPGLTFYNYAIGGAVCSVDVISSIYYVLQHEVPFFKADWQATRSQGMFAKATGNNTVYALWIGTNDLHRPNYGFFYETEPASVYLYSLVECYWRWIDSMYALGGRRFVVLTPPPLHLAPLDMMKTRTIAEKARQYCSSIGKMTFYGAAHELHAKRWPGASIMIFDTFQLMSDIHYNPYSYLGNPSFVDIAYKSCTNCQYPPKSFMWYDVLHPSSATHGVIAREFVIAVNQGSKYAHTFYS